MNSDQVRTAYLGRYDEFEAEVVLDILREHGITAYAKSGMQQYEAAIYPGTAERGTLLVEASRLDEARALIERELPGHLESIRNAMAQLEAAERSDDTPWGDWSRAGDDDGV